MKNRMNDLINKMADQLSESDLIASEQLAKISAQIVVSRIEKEMTQKEFATFMGVSQSMISKWEGEDYNFTVETLAKICEKLNLDLDISLKKKENKYMKKNKANEWKNLDSGIIALHGNGVA